jgi:hypothetical protein
MVGIDFDRSIEDIVPAPVAAPEAANIETPEIEAGFTFDNPL